MMTEAEIAEIEKRCEAALEGPWMVELNEDFSFSVLNHVETAPTISAKFYGDEIARRTSEFDVTDKHGYVIHNPKMNCGISQERIATLNFLAHSREDIPKLLKEVRDLRRQLGNTEGQ